MPIVRPSFRQTYFPSTSHTLFTTLLRFRSSSICPESGGRRTSSGTPTFSRMCITASRARSPRVSIAIWCCSPNRCDGLANPRALRVQHALRVPSGAAVADLPHAHRGVSLPRRGLARAVPRPVALPVGGRGGALAPGGLGPGDLRCERRGARRCLAALRVCARTVQRADALHRRAPLSLSFLTASTPSWSPPRRSPAC